MTLLALLTTADSATSSAEAPLASSMAAPPASTTAASSATSNAASPTSSTADLPVSTSSLLEEVLVERIVWPVRLKPRTPDGCDQVQPSQILVREDGAPARVTGVEKHNLSTLHVLLIDTSGSMMGLFSYTRSAAEEYIRALPPEHRVMLVTFDEDLRLWSPPTTDRSALMDALSRITVHVNHNTALWDAVYNTLHYLRWEESRKVLVLLTDGCDSLSLPDNTHRAVLEEVIASRHLSVYPVSMSNRPFPGARNASCSDPRNNELKQSAKNLLEPLARHSGGQLILSQGKQGIGRAFRQVLNRLSQEGVITYSALPFGEGPEDSPRKEFRWRRIKVKDDGLKNCSVTSAGPPHRRVQRDAPPTTSPPAEDFQAHGDFTIVETQDVTLSRGQLYNQDLYFASGRVLLEMDRAPQRGRRVAGVLVPPYDTLKSTTSRPHLLLAALLKACADPETCLNPSGRSLPLISGQTFFTLRPSLGRLLLAESGYGLWARQDIRTHRMAEAARLLDEIDGEVSPQARALVEETLLNRPYTPGEIQSRLARWLGDVNAVDLAASLEVDASHSATSRRQFRSTWPQLAAWFPLPTTTRNLTLLVPGHDLQRDAFGFYRIHLPTTRHGLPEDLVPPRPMATRILDWGHSPEGLTRLGRRPHKLEAVKYHPPDREQTITTYLLHLNTPRRLAEQARGWAVTMKLSPVNDLTDSRDSFTLRGNFILGDLLPRRPPEEEEILIPPRWEDLFCLTPVPLAGEPAAGDILRDLQATDHLCP